MRSCRTSTAENGAPAEVHAQQRRPARAPAELREHAIVEDVDAVDPLGLGDPVGQQDHGGASWRPPAAIAAPRPLGARRGQPSARRAAAARGGAAAPWPGRGVAAAPRRAGAASASGSSRPRSRSSSSSTCRSDSTSSASLAAGISRAAGRRPGCRRRASAPGPASPPRAELLGPRAVERRGPDRDRSVDSGSRKRSSSEHSVDLPAPEGPTRAIRSPGGQLEAHVREHERPPSSPARRRGAAPASQPTARLRRPRRARVATGTAASSSRRDPEAASSGTRSAASTRPARGSTAATAEEAHRGGQGGADAARGARLLPPGAHRQHAEAAERSHQAEPQAAAEPRRGWPSQLGRARGLRSRRWRPLEGAGHGQLRQPQHQVDGPSSGGATAASLASRRPRSHRALTRRATAIPRRVAARRTRAARAGRRRRGAAPSRPVLSGAEQRAAPRGPRGPRGHRRPRRRDRGARRSAARDRPPGSRWAIDVVEPGAPADHRAEGHPVGDAAAPRSGVVPGGRPRSSITIEQDAERGQPASACGLPMSSPEPPSSRTSDAAAASSEMLSASRRRRLGGRARRSQATEDRAAHGRRPSSRSRAASRLEQAGAVADLDDGPRGQPRLQARPGAARWSPRRGGRSARRGAPAVGPGPGPEPGRGAGARRR